MKPTAPPAPPRLRVIIFPFDWHVLMSAPTVVQMGKFVPGNVALSVGLQVCKDNQQGALVTEKRSIYTFARFIDGRLPGPKKVFTKAMGNTSTALS